VILGDEDSSARGPRSQEIDRTGLIAGLLAGSGVMNPHPTNGHHGPAVFVEPSARRGFFDSLRLPEPKETLSELVTEFDLRAASLLPDVDVPMSDLAMTEAGTINVPHQGAFTLTPWAKQQLASRLGVRWNRWFDGIDPKLRAGEINRRLERDTGVVRVKTDCSLGDDGSIGVLRGFVSPTYTTVPDALVAQAILDELRQGDPKIIRASQTDRTTSYVVQVGAPFHVGGPARVGDVVGGLLVRNSDVGYASLVVALHLTRLVCSNGMVVAESTAIVRRAHRHIDMRGLQEQLAKGLRELPSRIRRAAHVLERLAHHAVDHVPAVLSQILRDARLPQKLLPILLSAYGREPHTSALGVTQAITLAAQDASVSAEDRVVLERAAGKYMDRYAVR